jgi:glyoxylase-like metal-dependent hydrolase (beta-lactamase superfamily II)
MKKINIIRVSILPFGMVNCHLLVTEDGCVLVDTGLPGSAKKIGAALAKVGRAFNDIKLIVVTHAHVDHAGAAAELRELSGAPILAHADDLDYYERRKRMTYCVTSGAARLFLRTRVPLEPYTAFTPDMLMRDGDAFDLAPYGIEGVARHTPGHTAGSISLQLANGEMMVGDLLASGVLLGGVMRKGRAIRPPFEDDPQQVGRELTKLLAAGGCHFHLGHGGPLAAPEVARHARYLATCRPGNPFHPLD